MSGRSRDDSRSVCIACVPGALSPIAAPTYEPTRFELEVAAREWALIRLSSEWDAFWSGHTKCHVREMEVATQRILLIEGLIGAQRCQGPVRYAEDEFRRDKDPADWEVFKRMTPRLVEEEGGGHGWEGEPHTP